VSVEGGEQLIPSLMAARLLDYPVGTVASRFAGGEHGIRVQTDLPDGPSVRSFNFILLCHAQIPEDMVILQAGATGRDALPCPRLARCRNHV
jgi:riboflavin biosynthesis pyrimidine reductase